MAPRKRKKKIVDEGPFLFSEVEMSGMITNVAIIETPVTEKVDVPCETGSSDSNPLTLSVGTHDDVVTETEKGGVTDQESLNISVLSVDELTTDERIVEAMTNVLWQMKHMDKSQIRRIAFSITVMCQQGLELNKSYSVPVIQDEEMSGCELAAWCYCTFMSAFTSMQDKLQLPYAEHYNKAMESLNLN